MNTINITDCTYANLADKLEITSTQGLKILISKLRDEADNRNLAGFTTWAFFELLADFLDMLSFENEEKGNVIVIESIDEIRQNLFHNSTIAKQIYNRQCHFSDLDIITFVLHDIKSFIADAIDEDVRYGANPPNPFYFNLLLLLQNTSVYFKEEVFFRNSPSPTLPLEPIVLGIPFSGKPKLDKLAELQKESEKRS